MSVGLNPSAPAWKITRLCNANITSLGIFPGIKDVLDFGSDLQLPQAPLSGWFMLQGPTPPREIRGRCLIYKPFARASPGEGSHQAEDGARRMKRLRNHHEIHEGEKSPHSITNIKCKEIKGKKYSSPNGAVSFVAPAWSGAVCPSCAGKVKALCGL